MYKKFGYIFNLLHSPAKTLMAIFTVYTILYTILFTILFTI